MFQGRFVSSRLNLCASALAIIVAGASPAAAQDGTVQAPQASVPGSPDPAAQAAENQSGEDIVVTGSRIRREGYDTLQPTTVVGAEALQERAATNVADVINELPAFGVPGNSPTGDQSAVAVGQNFVNFFGLGSQRTLTLVNGKRFPPANTPSVNGPSSPGLQVDLNTIPTALIERVETVAVGGAPIYGSDAIAGTVNIILKKKFTGFDSTVQAAVTQRGDAARYRAQALYGFDFADGAGNIVANVEWNRQEPLQQTARQETAAQYSFQAPVPSANSPFLNVVVPNSRVAISNFNGLPLIRRQFNIFGGGARDAQGNFLQFSPSGDLVTFNPGTPTGSPVFYSGGDGINLAETASLLTSSDRYYANLFVNYEFSPSLRFHGEGWYSRTDAVETVNQPIYNSQAFTRRGPGGDTDARFVEGPFVIRLDNAFLTPQARGIIERNLTNPAGVVVPNLDLNGDGTAETAGFYVDKGSVDLLGGSPVRAQQNLYRVSAGLEGEFNLGEREFDWDLTYAYGYTSGASFGRTLLIDRLNQAVDAVAGPNGTVVCRNQANGCVPLNIFTNNPSAEAIAFVGADITTKTAIEQNLVSANVAGKLFKLPAGEIGFAVGADYRRESSRFSPDFISSSGLARGNPLTPVSGAFESKEVYGETLIPLVSPDMDIPLINRLEFEGAVRYVDNSRAGGDLTWTAGGRYAPIADVEFRGNFTRSIRAPAITELFLPTAQVAVFANDPCDARFLNQGNSPETRARNCAAAGVTQPFGSLIVNAAQLATTEGNQNLRNEKADAYTFGAVFRPRFLPGFTASADWVDIKLADAISSLDATTILQACYDSTDFPTTEVCSRFGRDAQGQIVGLRTGYVNAGALAFAGLTANLTYAFNLADIGRFALGVNYQYTDKLQVSVTGTDFNENAGEIGNSKHRVNANLAFSRDGFRWFWQAQYLDGAVFDNSDQANTRDVRGVGDWVVFNTSASIDVEKNFTLTLAVDNVFDRDAPRYSSLGNAGINTYFSGLLGRTFTIAARTRF